LLSDQFCSDTLEAVEYRPDMLHEFLTLNRTELIARCRSKVEKRLSPAKIPLAIDHGVPLFLQQLVETLRLEQREPHPAAFEVERSPAATEIGRAATVHGAELLRLGYTVDQVVHDYGDVCQAITELAVEHNKLIAAEEFRTLNRCLDNAIADAVTSFGSAHQVLLEDQAETLQQRLHYFALEHRRLVDIALQAYAVIKSGQAGATGATGTLLVKTLDDLGSLTDRTLPAILRGYETAIP
jgi:hypothetical protein